MGLHIYYGVLIVYHKRNDMQFLRSHGQSASHSRCSLPPLHPVRKSVFQTDSQLSSSSLNTTACQRQLSSTFQGNVRFLIRWNETRRLISVRFCISCRGIGGFSPSAFLLLSTTLLPGVSHRWRASKRRSSNSVRRR